MLHGDIGLGTPVPLPFMGGGVAQLVGILLVISAAPGGVVLVDEIENGFYYRHAAQVWGAIAAACRAADTQLFATTHSREWVLAAHTAFAESKTYDEDFRLHRMEGVDSAIRAVTYDKGTLQAAIDTDLELR